MSILSKIFSSGATELIKGVGDVVDNLTTTEEERLEAKRKIEHMVSSFEAEMQKEVTTRWTQDMNSDSWLSKNIRPLVLIFLVFSKFSSSFLRKASSFFSSLILFSLFMLYLSRYCKLNFEFLII